MANPANSNIRRKLRSSSRCVPKNIPIERAKLRTGHGAPYLIINACPQQGNHHPLDEWLEHVRLSANDRQLFTHLDHPVKVNVELDEGLDADELHGTVKLTWSFDNLGSSKAKLRMRCKYTGYDRLYRISLSGIEQIDQSFLDQLAAEIEQFSNT